MRIFKKEEDLMVVLNPRFQNKIFSELLRNRNSIELSKLLGKSSSIIYHYKNNLVRAIPKTIIKKAINISSFSSNDLLNNILRSFSAKNSLREIFNKGLEARRKQIKEELSINFGAFSLLNQIDKNLFLNILEWLEKNKWIEKIAKQKGIVQNVKIATRKDIEISYLVYNRGELKFQSYKVYLPKQLRFSLDFCYFLGLLYGDGLNGARVGIVNKNKGLIKWTAKFLKKYFKNNKVKAQLSIYNNSKINIKELLSWMKSFSNEVKTYYNSRARGYYVFNIFITNNILRRILDDFLNNLEPLFVKLNFQQKGAFLAGFFDAEGNVNKLDRNFRFSQKIENKVRTMQNLLIKEGYHTRYDGSNILIGFKADYKSDLDLFKKQILPFLKHSDKRIQAEELINGFFVREEYKPILKIILENPGIIQKDISTMIGRVKSNAKLNALVKANFVLRIRNRVDESFKYTITDKGLKYLGEKIR